MSDDRLARVEQACIAVEAVAARAGIGRATIYRHAEVNAVVHEHRRRGQDASTLTGLALLLRHAVEAVAVNVRRHEEQLRRLNEQTDAISCFSTGEDGVATRDYAHNPSKRRAALPYAGWIGELEKEPAMAADVGGPRKPREVSPASLTVGHLASSLPGQPPKPLLPD
jgi:hypothetical protein